MIHILISFLAGSIISLLLAAPSKYYLVLSLIPLIGFVVIVVMKSSIKKPNKYILISMPFIIILSYLLTSFVIFNPKSVEINIDSSKLKPEKEAVIFYCDGEMEKYIPYYAAQSLKDTPLVLKPIESFKIKKGYNSIGISEKNNELLQISNEFRSSLLQNSPKYFYTAYSEYTPSIRDAILNATKDECKKITFINFSLNSNSESTLETLKSSLTSKGLEVKITSNVLNSIKFEALLDSNIIDSKNYENVIVLTGKTDQNIKDALYKKGFKEANIFIDKNVKDILKQGESFKANSKNLIINLLDFKGSLYEKHTIINATKKYDSLKFDIISPYRYRNDMLEIIINEYQNAK